MNELGLRRKLEETGRCRHVVVVYYEEFYEFFFIIPVYGKNQVKIVLLFKKMIMQRRLGGM